MNKRTKVKSSLMSFPKEDLAIKKLESFFEEYKLDHDSKHLWEIITGKAHRIWKFAERHCMVYEDVLRKLPDDVEDVFMDMCANVYKDLKYYNKETYHNLAAFIGRACFTYTDKMIASQDCKIKFLEKKYGSIDGYLYKQFLDLLVDSEDQLDSATESASFMLEHENDLKRIKNSLIKPTYQDMLYRDKFDCKADHSKYNYTLQLLPKLKMVAEGKLAYISNEVGRTLKLKVEDMWENVKVEEIAKSLNLEESEVLNIYQPYIMAGKTPSRSYGYQVLEDYLDEEQD